MRIIIPYSGGEDSFQDNVAQTLAAHGHEVLCAPPAGSFRSTPWVGFLGNAYQKLYPARWSREERWLVAAARGFRPELVLSLTQLVCEEVLHELKQICAPRLAAWWGDPPANLHGLGLLSSAWDGVFLKDGAAVNKFTAVGLPAYLLHEAANPTWHRRVFQDIGRDVVVAGSCYGYRQYLVEQLALAGVNVALYGPKPPRWARPKIRRLHRGRYIVKEEKSRLFGEGLACLNSTSLAEGNSLNCRAFEIAAAAGLQLIEDKPAVSECFEPGHEVLTYRSVEDICQYLDRAEKDPTWALAVRLAGHARAQSQHTYSHRLTAMFSTLDLAL